MKIAVIKLGTRIVNKGTSGGSGEALSIMKILSYNYEVHYFTKILKKDKDISYATGHQILETENLDEFDKLVVINGNVNFFGGSEDEAQIKNYILINNFRGKVFYFYCDPELYLKQIWSSIERKPWGNKYNKKDIFIDKKIIYIHQPYNIEPFKKQIEKWFKVEYKHFPFYKFPLLNKRLEYKYPKKTLGYGGTLRGGKREQKIIDFLFGVTDSYIFGPITLDKFKKYKSNNTDKIPIFEKAVEYSKYLDKMEEFKATINIGDKKYQGNNLNQRIYEAVLSNTVSFIDIELDPKKIAFKNEKLRKFLYVKNKNELSKRLEYLTPENHKKLCDLQYSDCKLNPQEYSNELKLLLEGEL